MQTKKPMLVLCTWRAWGRWPRPSPAAETRPPPAPTGSPRRRRRPPRPEVNGKPAASTKEPARLDAVVLTPSVENKASGVQVDNRLGQGQRRHRLQGELAPRSGQLRSVEEDHRRRHHQPRRQQLVANSALDPNAKYRVVMEGKNASDRLRRGQRVLVHHAEARPRRPDVRLDHAGQRQHRRDRHADHLELRRPGQGQG